MRFAFVTDELPQPGFAGHQAMNHAIIAWLRSCGHEVTILLLRPRLTEVWTHYDAAEIQGIGVWTWRQYVFPASIQAAFTIVARSLMGSLPAGSGRFLRKHFRSRRYGRADTVLGAFATPEQTAWCATRLLAMAPDAIFADTIFRAPVLRAPTVARIRSVIIAHDVFHLRHRALRSAGYTVYPESLTAELEAGLLNAATAIAAIQPEESALIRKLCPERTVCTVPMPALPCPRPEKVVRIPGRLVFVGSAALPNLDGLRWLLAEIWPLLRKAHPTVTLDVVGDCGSMLPVLPAGARRLGRVRDLSPILHRSAMAISPLRVGSGLKIKILDYARHGLITVGTTESLQGFAADAHAPFIAAADAQGFAEAVTAGLQRNNVAGEKTALEYVAKHYSVNASFSGLAAALGWPEGAAKRV